jgi:hypothetical protein
MPTADPQEVIRAASDIDWLEEEAWRRASQWTITPALVMWMRALIAEETMGRE